MIIILIPAYNEDAAIGSLMSGIPAHLRGHDVRTVVVNDGSTDNTAAEANRAGAEVLDFTQNRGKGAVLKAGIGSVSGDAYDVLVMMDGDGQHDPACLESMVIPILDGSYDVVVGSRYMDGGGRGDTPWNRYVVRLSVRAALRVLVGTAVTDPFSGYRAFSPHGIACMQLRGDRYESELEMLFCASRKALPMSEVPIPKIYGSGMSKMGARNGLLLGRIDVVFRYATTIAREALRSRSPSAIESDQVTAA
jgi:glycosyltransferase involved in cell wall biosynthesis